MASIKIDEQLKQFFFERKKVSSRELFEYFRLKEPKLKHSTFLWRVYNLKSRGLLVNVRRGVYALGSAKPEFQPPISRKIRDIDRNLKEAFPYLKYCIWTTRWVSDFMVHQPGSFFYVVDVEQDAVESVFYMLRDLWRTTKVFVKPSSDEFERYAVGYKNVIIVKNLVSEAPLIKVQNIPVPGIEKILVDLFVNSEIFTAYQGAEFANIFQEIDSRFNINKSRMLRYARRRKAEEKLIDFLNRYAVNSMDIDK